MTHSPGLTRRDLGFHARDDFSHRSGVRELDAIEFFDAAFGNVGMGIDKAGRGGMSVKVDDADAGSFTRKIQNLGVGADFHNDAAAGGDGFHDRVLGVDRENVAVQQKKIGAGSLRGQVPGQ